ncbi:type IX secretion system sortase PorU [Algoriphagus sp. AK58]|uniref:type IX secretion system sortase PorU n=1 Tax=Algoriphagus sp. AK58 TaxID=1406877 RepID=UPI0021033687|nr:type IX secretion system sortase PorU [Algoriphagus sp. AK58]MBC6366638.1 peptidase C25 [Algoriphagus sp. AK58]
MSKNAFLCIFNLFFGVILIPAFAQNSFVKFSITESGIYRITSSQAQQAGFVGLDEIAVFGYPGMLPQVLDSTQLKLQEIPALRDGENLFFFLEGPNQAYLTEQKTIHYEHHLYSDSLTYLLGRKNAPKRITEIPGSMDSADPNQIWYVIKSFKEEKTNLLNSGRSWYSDPIRQGQSLTVNFGITSTSNAPWILATRIMAQPTSVAQMRLFSSADLLTEINFNPIPNTTYGIKGREELIQLDFFPVNNRLSQIRYTYQGTGAGYLDYLSVAIPYQNSTLSEGVYYGEKEEAIQFAIGRKMWEISNFFSPIAYSSGNSAKGKKWVIFSPSTVKSIASFQPVSLDLNPQSSPELVIITSPQLQSVASKLRDHKISRGVQTEVVTTSQIFDAFGYGNRDVTAIRNFIAWRYHWGKQLKHVLILGKGTFDYKRKLGGRPNLVPIYTSRNSLDPLRTFSSDDYFALIEWGQGQWEESREGDEALQIGVGRVPAITFEEANSWVEKLIRYENASYSLPFNPTLNFLADDGDNSIHMRDAEVHARFLTKNHPFYKLEKLYLDRFEQEKTGNFQRSAGMRAALEKNLDSGTLILNYIGHGNETTLTAEEIFNVQDIENWAPQDQLALWMTATCEFGRHDSPFIRSAAEELLFAKGKGAMGLLSTGRPVFSSVNFTLNQAFIEEVFKKENHKYQTLGAIFKNTKNKSLNGSFNRNFSLLGDPSLNLAHAELGVKIEKIEDLQTGIEVDSVRPSQAIQLSGTVIDPISSAHIPNFSGEFQLELRDQPEVISTLGDENSPFEFEDENRILFKGKGEVKNGKFSGQIKAPVDLGEEFRKGNLRIIAWDSNNRMQATGFEQLNLGGPQTSQSSDLIGPEIQVSIARTRQTPFVSSSRQVELTADFYDLSGIYVSNQNSDQILRVQINQSPPIPISELFKSLEGGFQKGQVILVIKDLQEGLNQIQIAAWDNAGNKGELSFSIEVRGSETLRIIEHQVYPNPSSEKSTFLFRHNRPGENLLGILEVYSSTGQILFSESRRFVKAEEIIDNWHWIFFQSKTKYPGKGTYIYKLTLRSESDLTSDTASGKLLIQ